MFMGLIVLLFAIIIVINAHYYVFDGLDLYKEKIKTINLNYNICIKINARLES